MASRRRIYITLDDSGRSTAVSPDEVIERTDDIAEMFEDTMDGLLIGSTLVSVVLGQMLRFADNDVETMRLLHGNFASGLQLGFDAACHSIRQRMN